MREIDDFYAIYNSIYFRHFSFFDADQKSIMQFTVFLHDIYTEESNYDFIVLNGAIFSQNLQNDLFDSRNRTGALPELSDTQKKFVSFMKKLLWQKPRIYSTYKWLLYISLIMYYKRYLQDSKEKMHDFVIAQVGDSFDENLLNHALRSINALFF